MVRSFIAALLLIFAATVVFARSYPTVYFGNDSVELYEETANVLREAGSFGSMPDVCGVTIWGHADQSETDPLELSRRRAEVVKQALLARNVPEHRITMMWTGAKYLRVPNTGPKSDPQNRRTEIFARHKSSWIRQEAPLLGPMPPDRLHVPFEPNKSELFCAGPDVVALATDYFRKLPVRKIELIGAAGGGENKSEVAELSRRRAEAVKAAFIQQGVPQELIEISVSDTPGRNVRINFIYK